jgi:hypothetical protein
MEGLRQPRVTMSPRLRVPLVGLYGIPRNIADPNDQAANRVGPEIQADGILVTHGSSS